MRRLLTAILLVLPAAASAQGASVVDEALSRAGCYARVWERSWLVAHPDHEAAMLALGAAAGSTGGPDRNLRLTIRTREGERFDTPVACTPSPAFATCAIAAGAGRFTLGALGSGLRLQLSGPLRVQASDGAMRDLGFTEPQIHLQPVMAGLCR
ncbi:hypothetical protein NPA31_001515 [Aurantimonas sp. MSK8Z-1]|uniref:hypothetical protein n=1 Tax=Mangrovibrevibacter kandeliae TaxID=2968473 RepID=UPI00211788EE|nr:hypothetical protein [Aurantimonas sp. MSK8Z-1]MCW4113639.1 hypothetical protein [Aurantimonas sp. MSK8Z-1]